MPVSLRVISVLICIVLTLVTAVLTLAVSLSFTKKAVDDLGLRYSSSLASNLKHSVQDYLQGAASQYAGVAQNPAMSSRGPPNTTWTPGWNGSFWTFDASDLDELDRYFLTLTSVMTSHNFTRDSSSLMCFVDGTYAQVGYVGSSNQQFNWNAVAGRGPSPIGAASPASYTFTQVRYFGYGKLQVANTSSTVTHPTPWSMPVAACAFNVGQPCSTFDCRARPQFLSGNPYGRDACWWMAPFVSNWSTAVTGVFCTMYNSLNQRLGVTGGVMTLDAVSAFVASVSRTENGHAFAVDSANWRLLGSSYPRQFQRAWNWANATYNATTNSFRNSSAFPISITPVAPNTEALANFGASFVSPTAVRLLPECLVGTLSFAQLVICQQTIFSYGYEPLLALHSQVGLDPTHGFRQGSIVSGEGQRYYYALDGVATRANGRVLPRLLWTVVVLTPEDDVLGKVNQGRSYSIIATVSFFVFAAGCCFVLFTIFLRPLTELEDKMLMTANLQDEQDTDESLSSLTEVRNMQSSFYKLRTQLRRLKSYVPQSVLAALNDDGEEEGSAAPPQGSEGDGTEVEDVKTARSSQQQPRRRADDVSSSHSRSSRKSSSRYTVSSGGHAVRLLNTQVGLVKKSVSVLVFNIIGLHSQLRSHSPEDFVRLHSKLVENFHGVVTQEKGIVDSFQGDRFVATFNAVTNNAQHAVRACVAAQQLLAGTTKLMLPFARYCIGVASGDALVGNAGTEALRRFCTVGRVYTQATAMERFTKQHGGADVVVSSGTAGQVRHEFYVEALDLVMFEGGARPSIVFALRERMNHALEEWNYAMLQNEARDKYSAVNEAFARFAEGDPSGSRAILATLPEIVRRNAGYERLNALLQANAAPLEYAATNQGRYFASSFAAQ